MKSFVLDYVASKNIFLTTGLNYKSELLAAGDEETPTLLVLCAPFCGYCRALAPVLGQL